MTDRDPDRPAVRPRRRAPRRGIAADLLAPLALALGVFASVYLSESALARPPDSPPPAGFSKAYRLLRGSRAPSCPLPAGKQVAAVQAFSNMLPVFRHPRCLNCHGGVDVLDADRHPGASALDDALDPRTALHSQEFVRAFEAQCEDCHDGLKGWTVPPPPIFFVDPETGVPKNDQAMCLQMKRSGSSGAHFISHIFHDHGGIQFIAAGFRGDRALGSEELARLGLTADRPPGTQLDLADEAAHWVDLMGARAGWVGDPECGCVLPSIRLRVRHRSEDNRGDASTAAGWADFQGELQFEVTLAPVRVDATTGRMWFRGDTTLVRALEVHFATAQCRGPISQSEDWIFSGQVDPGETTMRLQFNHAEYDQRHSVVCTIRGHTSPAMLDPALFSELDHMVIPLDSEETHRATAEEPNGTASEWIEITIVEAAPGA